MTKQFKLITISILLTLIYSCSDKEKNPNNLFNNEQYSSLVDLVNPFVELYKIGSGDASWLEIIEYVLEKGKPTLLATGACDLDDVKRMMELALSKTSDIVLMQCNTNYTGSQENFQYCNLNVLKYFAKEYPNTMLGLSDHTTGHATTLGALRVFLHHLMP